MSKIRINDLARELEVKSKEILDTLTTVGITEKKTHSSSLEDHEADLVRKHLRGRSDASASSSRTSRTAHTDDGFKTKIDLSHISRPGDALRLIKQQKEVAEQPPARRRRRRCHLSRQLKRPRLRRPRASSLQLRSPRRTVRHRW